ncbi:serine/threonine protein kinase [Magnaporthiopsis poae ATCC 64411]|uniref:non-specific serine/threonine protein kinase n=1 Tax=Magnaporthiopsis poae (strain ATCC 64411 / 73-15) TaxID=644358 RepID=A0A0C4DX97_MAGP6|nr:serine/threonine protein kinase [Magnaporthiopsis poae ATCC 64411]
MDDYFFTLAPANDAAVAVVMANAHFVHEGVLRFAANFVSKVLSCVACFGKDSNTNDVVLPSHTAYRNDHFAFFLAPSGELILRDKSENGLSLWIEGVPDNEQAIYGLSGRTTRQRVIPRVNCNVHIVCGNSSTCLEFTLRWNPQCLVVDSVEIQVALAALAYRRLGENTPFQLPNTSDRMAADRAQQAALQGSCAPGAGGHTLRSHFRPSYKNVTDVGPPSGLTRARLSTDTISSVRVGLEWFPRPLISPRVKSGPLNEGATLANAMTFKIEVGKLARLDHPNITRLESFQDFKLGHRFQIFYALHHGNASSLTRDYFSLHGHDCRRVNALPPPIWAPRFIEQTTLAMEYLITRSVLHCDLKPDNILFDRDSSGEITNFCIPDFGLARMASAMSGLNRGTNVFMSPELITGRAGAREASDVWAFGITLGCVLGYWCGSPFCLLTPVPGSSIEAMAAAVPDNAPRGHGNQPNVEQTRVRNTNTGHTLIHDRNTGRTTIHDPITGETVIHDFNTKHTIALDPNTGQGVTLDPNTAQRIAVNLHPELGWHYRRTVAVMSIVQHGVLPPAFRHILDRPDARPRFENTLRRAVPVRTQPGLRSGSPPQ